MAKRRTATERRRLVYKKGMCERCGFRASHPSQIDVHHVDGDRTNDVPSNWQSLCANCHRLVTYAPHLV
ncbi:MAG: HNH endonuclease [Rubrobacter sp.]|nr:HNH endonuclease [Rubrobacter sp.]